MINFKIRDKIYRLIHGNGWVLVYPPALKPVWEVRSCLGGFDSHTFPPFEPNFGSFFCPQRAFALQKKPVSIIILRKVTFCDVIFSSCFVSMPSDAPIRTQKADSDTCRRSCFGSTPYQNEIALLSVCRTTTLLPDRLHLYKNAILRYFLRRVL